MTGNPEVISSPVGLVPNALVFTDRVSLRRKVGFSLKCDLGTSPPGRDVFFLGLFNPQMGHQDVEQLPLDVFEKEVNLLGLRIDYSAGAIVDMDRRCPELNMGTTLGENQRNQRTGDSND